MSDLDPQTHRFLQRIRDAGNILFFLTTDPDFDPECAAHAEDSGFVKKLDAGVGSFYGGYRLTRRGYAALRGVPYRPWWRIALSGFGWRKQL